MSIKVLNCAKLKRTFYIFLILLLGCSANNFNITKFDKKFILDLKSTDDMSSIYFPFLIGTNNQLMNLGFSTGSYLSWVKSQDCLTCGEGNKYNYMSSGGFRNNTGVHDIQILHNLNIQGYYVSDELKINNKQSIQSINTENNFETLNLFSFILASNLNETTNFFNKSKLDGQIGLNLRAVNDKNNNFVSQLYEGGLISSLKFATYFSLNINKIFFGDFTESTTISPLFKLMSFCKVPDKSHGWECLLSSIDIGKTTINPSSNVRIDTGRSNLIIPLLDYKIVKKNLFGVSSSECIRDADNKVICKCPSPNIYPNIVLYLSNSPFVINTKELINYDSKRTYQCQFDIFIDIDNEDTWIVGRNLLQNTLLSFDQGKRRLGFIQNPKGIESLLLGQNVIFNSNDSVDSKIGFIFFLLFLFVLMFGLFKCANSDNFFSRNSLNADDKEDAKKMELLKQRFNAEEYDFDDTKGKDEKAKYYEMKDMKEINP